MEPWMISVGVMAACLGGMFIGYCLRWPVPVVIEESRSDDEGLIDATLHEQVITLLISAYNCPGMSAQRDVIKFVLGESGYEVGCKDGRCGLSRNNTFQGFVKQPVPDVSHLIQK